MYEMPRAFNVNPENGLSEENERITWQYCFFGQTKYFLKWAFFFLNLVLIKLKMRSTYFPRTIKNSRKRVKKSLNCVEKIMWDNK